MPRGVTGRCVFPHAVPTGTASSPKAVPMTQQIIPESSPRYTAERNNALTDWQYSFEELLPQIQCRLRFAFRGLSAEAKDEAVQEATCHACRAYASLAEQRRTQVATAASLARFAVAQFRAGRRFGHRLNINDVSSEYCQQRRCLKVFRLNNSAKASWSEALVEDRTVTPADLAASRIDYPAFLGRLGQRDRRIAEVLATGETTRRVAMLFGLSVGRVSQLRRELFEAWQQFHATLSEKTSL